MQRPMQSSMQSEPTPMQASAPRPAPAMRNSREEVATRPPSAPRLPQEGTESNIGTVLELGQSSVRVKTSKEMKGAFRMSIYHGAGQQLDIPVEVESSSKVGSRHYDTIVQIIELTASQRQLLRQIAMTNRNQRTIAQPFDQ